MLMKNNQIIWLKENRIRQSDQFKTFKDIKIFKSKPPAKVKILKFKHNNINSKIKVTKKKRFGFSHPHNLSQINLIKIQNLHKVGRNKEI